MYFPHVAKREGNKKMQKVAEFVVFVGCTWQICSSCGKIAPSSVVCPKNYSQFCRTPQPQVLIFRPSDGVRGHLSGCVGRLRAVEHRVVAGTAEQVGRLRWEMSLKNTTLCSTLVSFFLLATRSRRAIEKRPSKWDSGSAKPAEPWSTVVRAWGSWKCWRVPPNNPAHGCLASCRNLWWIATS